MEENNPNKKYIPTCRVWTSLNREICFLSNPMIRVITSRTDEKAYWNSKYLFNGKLIEGSQIGWASFDNNYNFIEIYFDDPVAANVLYLTGTQNSTYPPTAFEIKASNDPVNYVLLSFVQNVEWEPLEDKSFQFENSKKYKYYQIIFTASKSTIFALTELNLGYEEK